MIEITLVSLALALAVAWVLYPLRSGGRSAPEPHDDERSEAESATRSALTALVDIEEERTIGKLEEADFEALRRQYEAEALAALKRLEGLERTGRDDDLESEISAMRARLTCPSCGAIRSAQGVCDRCGAH